MSHFEYTNELKEFLIDNRNSSRDKFIINLSNHSTP